MIGNGRLVFADPSCNDAVGVFSVGDFGWVTQWLDGDPEVVEAMYPPTAVLTIVFNEPEPEEGGSDV